MKTCTGGAVPIMNQYDMYVPTGSEMVPYVFAGYSTTHANLNNYYAEELLS